MKRKRSFEQTVLNSLHRIERRLTRVEIRTAAIAATVAILVKVVFGG